MSEVYETVPALVADRLSRPEELTSEDVLRLVLADRLSRCSDRALGGAVVAVAAKSGRSW